VYGARSTRDGSSGFQTYSHIEGFDGSGLLAQPLTYRGSSRGSGGGSGPELSSAPDFFCARSALAGAAPAPRRVRVGFALRAALRGVAPAAEATCSLF